MKANIDIRKELRKANIPLWKLGITMGVSEMTIIRKLRTELSETEKNVIRRHIKRIIAEESDDENDYFSSLKEFRCVKCNRLLAQSNSETKVKCPRCRELNHFNREQTSQ